MIIGLSGYAQSGKDTVANYLVTNKGFTRVAFADPIKELLYEMNPIIDEQNAVTLQNLVDNVSWEGAKLYPEVRSLLQNLGMGGRKVFNRNFWIDVALEYAQNNSHEGPYVVTDVRFKNEAKRIKNMGGQIWRVERPFVNAVNGHISEHDLDDWEFDAIIHNNSTIEDLAFAVQTTLMARVK